MALDLSAYSRPDIPTDQDRIREIFSVPLKDSGWEGGSHREVGFIARILKSALSIYNFQFNPTELSGSSKAKWAIESTPGSPAPIGSFMFTESSGIDLELFFDATDKVGEWKNRYRTVKKEFWGVWADIEGAIQLVNPDYTVEVPEAEGKFRTPSPVLFAMGPIIRRCVVTQVKWKITEWFVNLIPSRATVNFEFQTIGRSRSKDEAMLKSLQTVLFPSRYVKASDSVAGFVPSTFTNALRIYGAENLFVE